VVGGGLGLRRDAVEGGASFWRSGAASGRRRWAWRHRRRKGGGEHAAGKHRGGWGKWLGASVGWAQGGQGGRERTCGLFGPTHFGPKSEIGMDARERLRTTLSVWVTPLGRVFCLRGRVRMRSGRLRRPGGDALRASSASRYILLSESIYLSWTADIKIRPIRIGQGSNPTGRRIYCPPRRHARPNSGGTTPGTKFRHAPLLSP
jgi:hypothetical protein